MNWIYRLICSVLLTAYFAVPNMYSFTYEFDWNEVLYQTQGNSLMLYTPKGTQYQVVEMGEAFSTYLIYEINSYYNYRYPQATKLGDTTTHYNCRGYAWVMSEGGPTCWGYLNVSPNWTDGSYVTTSSTLADKVEYIVNGEHIHSAIPSSMSGKYESKWGYGPLMRHALNYTPYSGSTYIYYKHATPTLSGTNMIGGSETGTYTLSCKPQYQNVIWSYDTSLLTQTATTDRSITLRPRTTTSAGDATLTARIYDASGTLKETVNYYIGVGGPHYRDVSIVVKRSSDGTTVYPSGTGLSPNSYYYAYLSGASACSSITWSPDSHLQNLQSNNDMMYFKTDSQGWGMLEVYGTVSRYGISKRLSGVTLYGGY